MTREREEKIASLVRTSVAISHLSCIDGRNVRFRARTFLKRLTKKPYHTVRGFINARISIALVRATNRIIRGSRIPLSNKSNRFRWEGGARLGLLKSDH